jgi:Lon protease-like protein
LKPADAQMASGYSGGGRLPAELPVFPLTGVLLLPRGRLPLNIFEKRYLAMCDDALAGDRLIGMIQPSDPYAADRSPPLFTVGCAGRITSFNESGDGRYLVALDGVARFKVREELPLHRGYRRIVADWTNFAADLDEEAFAFDRHRLIRLLQAYFRQQQLSANWDAIGQAPDERLLTSLAMICPFQPPEKQALLEAGCLSDRARLMMSLLEIAIASHGEGDPARH